MALRFSVKIELNTYSRQGVFHVDDWLIVDCVCKHRRSDLTSQRKHTLSPQYSSAH